MLFRSHWRCERHIDASSVATQLTVKFADCYMSQWCALYQRSTRIAVSQPPITAPTHTVSFSETSLCGLFQPKCLTRSDNTTPAALSNDSRWTAMPMDNWSGVGWCSEEQPLLKGKGVSVEYFFTPPRTAGALKSLRMFLLKF